LLALGYDMYPSRVVRLASRGSGEKGSDVILQTVRSSIAQLPKTRDTYHAAQRLGARLMPSMAKVLWGLPEIDIDALTDGAGSLSAPLLLDDCCLPPYHSNGPTTHNDIVPLVQIAAYRKPSIILELGTAHGNTIANLARICDARLFTVNALPEQMSGAVTTFALRQEDIGRVYRTYGYESRVTQVYANTLVMDLRSYMAPETIDLAVIDACHDTSYVINDFLKVLPYVRDGGILLLHDTHPSMKEHLVGSYMACMTLRRSGYDIKHLCNTWWGVYVKNKTRA